MGTSNTAASVYQQVQWGHETTVGTAVPATTAFRCLEVEAKPNVETDLIRPSGSRFASTSYIKKSMTDVSAEGIPSWTELPSLLQWALGDNVESIDNGDGTHSHSFELAPYSATTRTFEIGEPGTNNYSRVRGAFVKSFGFMFGRQSGDSKMTIEGLGMNWEDDATPTGNPIYPNVSPIIANDIELYLDDTLGAAGTTRMAGVLSFEFASGDMRSDAWYFNHLAPSFSDTVDQAMTDATITLVMKADADGRAFFDALAIQETKYIQVRAFGPDGKDFTGTFAVRAKGHERGDEEGIWAVTAELVIVEDETGFSHEFVVTNDEATV